MTSFGFNALWDLHPAERSRPKRIWHTVWHTQMLSSVKGLMSHRSTDLLRNNFNIPSPDVQHTFTRRSTFQAFTNALNDVANRCHQTDLNSLEICWMSGDICLLTSAENSVYYFIYNTINLFIYVTKLIKYNKQNKFIVLSGDICWTSGDICWKFCWKFTKLSTNVASLPTDL